MKCLAALFALCLSATPILAAPAGSVSPKAAPALVQAGGILQIQVAGEPSLSKGYMVDAAGHITLDMVGQIDAAGHTPEQIADDLRTRLKQFLRQPNVTVSQFIPLRQEVLVTGEVLRPSALKLQPGDGLLDALAAVGGLGPRADAAHATLVRRGQSHTQSLNIEALLKGDLSQNLPLSDGDIIQIPKKEIATYQVVGEVKLPGPRAIDGTTKVLDAILSTGGLTDRADRSRITLTRKNQAQPIVIDLDQVLAGETSANVLVQPGDVLTVAPRMVVQVVGEVRAPSERLIRNGGTVLEAIMFAGGFAPDADRTSVQITHKDGATEKCSLADITTVVGGPVLRPGDLVVVGHSTPESITLIGAVRAPGPMKYQNGMKITDALMAAGLLENSKWKEIRVIRGEDGPGRKILMFDLESYLKAPKTMNLALQAGDRIFVETQKRGGTSFFRTLLQMAPLASIFFPLFGL